MILSFLSLSCIPLFIFLIYPPRCTALLWPDACDQPGRAAASQPVASLHYRAAAGWCSRCGSFFVFRGGSIYRQCRYGSMLACCHTASRTKEDERIHMHNINNDELISLLKPQGKKAKADQLILSQTGGNMHLHHDMEEATTQSECSDVGVGGEFNAHPGGDH